MILSATYEDFLHLSGLSVVFFNILLKPNTLPFWYFSWNTEQNFIKCMKSIYFAWIFMQILFSGIFTTEQDFHEDA